MNIFRMFTRLTSEVSRYTTTKQEEYVKRDRAKV